MKRLRYALRHPYRYWVLSRGIKRHLKANDGQLFNIKKEADRLSHMQAYADLAIIARQLQVERDASYIWIDGS